MELQLQIILKGTDTWCLWPSFVLCWLFDEHQTFPLCQLASTSFPRCLTLFFRSPLSARHFDLKVFLCLCHLQLCSKSQKLITLISCLCLSLFPASIIRSKIAVSRPVKIQIPCWVRFRSALVAPRPRHSGWTLKELVELLWGCPGSFGASIVLSTSGLLRQSPSANFRSSRHVKEVSHLSNLVVSLSHRNDYNLFW